VIEENGRRKHVVPTPLSRKGDADDDDDLNVGIESVITLLQKLNTRTCLIFFFFF
jgi:hypothetical protein